MSQELLNLNQTIKELKTKISVDPDPFLVEVLNRLMVIRENQQTVLIEKTLRKERYFPDGGFRGYGIS